MVRSQTYFSRKITLLNAAATIMIILLHAKPMERFSLPLSLDYPVIYSIWVFTQTAVPLFFFISGLLFYRNCEWTNIKSKLKRRILSLLVPYLIWNIFFVALMFSITHIPGIGNVMKGTEILNSPSRVFWSIITARCTSLWFVKDLMYFCIAAPVILICIKTPFRAILLTIASLIVIFWFDFGYEHCLNWLPIYLMGATIGRFTDANKTLSLSNVKISGIFLSLLFLFIYISSIVCEDCIPLFRLISPLLIWIGIDLIGQKAVFAYKQRDWMKYTFVIYCTQQFVLNVIEKIFVLIMPPTHATMFITFVVSSCLAWLTCYGIAKYLSRFKVYKYLSGGR